MGGMRWQSRKWAVTAALALVALTATTFADTPISEARAAKIQLTPLQEAGQRVIYSYPGLTVPQSLLTAIQNGQAGGVIFFKENVSSLTQIAGVVQQLNRAQEQSPVQAPLLLMTDQEGGQVRRLPGEPVLSQKQIGASSNASMLATQAGTGAGNNLRGVGMNLNLAPVLDVYRTAGDFMDQYGRSYSTNAGVCGNLSRNFITAQQAVKVAATAKHFPGIGSATTSQNTDAQPVTLNVPLSTLRTVDEAPYGQAISAGVKLVMTSWAVYPALDANRPAGLSSTIVQQELRSRLGFGGVTITDAIEAGALQAYGTTGQRSVLAAQAGMDLVLASARDVSQGQAATTALANALQSGQLDQAAFTASLNRINALRNSLA